MRRKWWAVVLLLALVAVVAALLLRREERTVVVPDAVVTSTSSEPHLVASPGAPHAIADASTEPAAQLAPLTVRVVSHGQPVAGARVSSWSVVGVAAGTSVYSWNAGPGSTTAADGRAVLDVSAGRWLVAIEVEHHQRRNALVTHSAEHPGVAEFDLGEGLVVRGVVVAKKTQQPVPGATVTVRLTGMHLPDEAKHSVTTDINGRFVLEDLTASQDWFVVSAPSYATQQAILGVPRADLRVELLDGSYLTGHVFLSDGGVVAGARVVATSLVEISDESTSTGAFALEVGPGTYDLGASHDGLVASFGHSVSVAPGETVADLDLVLRPGGRLEGSVHSDRTGEAVAGAEVIVSPHGVAAEIARAVTDATGHYVARPIPGGTLDVQVRARGFSEFAARGLLTSEGAVTQLDAMMLEPGTIAGHVQTRDRPLGGIKVVVTMGAEATTDARGDFLLPGLSPGETRLTLERPDYPDVHRSVTVPAGQTVHETFTLEDRLRQVTGVLLDVDGGVAPEGATVGAELNGLWGDRARVTTGPNGAFTLGLTDGRWHLFAYTNHGRAAQDLDVNEKTAPVTLRLQSTRQGTSCLVLDEQNHPVAGALVVFSHGDSFSAGVSGSDGQVPVTGPSMNATTVTAASQKRLGSSPFSATDCTVHLERPATLVVRFRTRPRAPVTVSVPDGLPGNTGRSATFQVTGDEAEFAIPPGTTTLEFKSGALGAAPTVTAAPGQRVELEVTLQRPDGG